MDQRLFGVETEYAFTALRRDGSPLDTQVAAQRFINLAKKRFPHLRDMHSHGLFLGNGSRLYVDSGSHPEMSTPECSNPWEVVRYLSAGDRILARLADELAANESEVANVTILKSNVDYSGSLSTWGCHESYLHTADPRTIPEQIIPHLVSRIVYTGAGGFDTASRGLKFTLSPRVSHLVNAVSDQSTHSRGIFHTKDESLCGDGYHRLHILCGESLCSQIATWLKIGSTALTVAMIEAGLRPGDGVGLASPLETMRRFAKDEKCSAAVTGTNGKNLTATAIQRHYLNLAEAHVHEPFMPSWAGDVVTVWRMILDRLEQDAPQSVATVLDWAIKLTLYKNRLGQRDLKLEGPVPVGLKRELFEIDSRFGQLGERGIFTVMDRAGVLDHRTFGVGDIEHAVHNPPAVGRAALRGHCIKRLARDGNRYGCDWQGVWDLEGKRFLDLSNPFAAEERWRDTLGPRSERSDRPA